jgi:hypothetical protein
MNFAQCVIFKEYTVIPSEVVSLYGMYGEWGRPVIHEYDGCMRT